MKIYFAPLEGVTGYIYRRAHWKYYGGADKYFTPFLSPTKNKAMTYRERNDILPEHNGGLTVPQILTNQAEYFVDTVKELQNYGYTEVNLNLGCPSKTVTTKRKGSGFLAYPEELNRFLEKCFANTDIAISVKTRIGVSSEDEFGKILEIFRQYPIAELTVHPRLQTDLYRGMVRLEAFDLAYAGLGIPLCYNGDIHTAGDYRKIIEKYPGLNAVMIGRGFLANPALGSEIKNQEEHTFDKDRFLAFHEQILRDYTAIMSGDKNTLFKMKELWFYMIQMFPEKDREYKKLKKAQTIREYEDAVYGIVR